VEHVQELATEVGERYRTFVYLATVGGWRWGNSLAYTAAISICCTEP
jgi:hypothetical protein